MFEFNQRMTTQRNVLRIVNSHKWSEELCGLSSHAINRWVTANDGNVDNQIEMLLREIASQLFFLASKSQEQVSDHYKQISSTIQELTSNLRSAVG